MKLNCNTYARTQILPQGSLCKYCLLDALLSSGYKDTKPDLANVALHAALHESGSYTVWRSSCLLSTQYIGAVLLAEVPHELQAWSY